MILGGLLLPFWILVKVRLCLLAFHPSRIHYVLLALRPTPRRVCVCGVGGGGQPVNFSCQHSAFALSSIYMG